MSSWLGWLILWIGMATLSLGMYKLGRVNAENHAYWSGHADGHICEIAKQQSERDSGGYYG